MHSSTFTSVIHADYPRLLAMLRRKAGDRELAEDLLQDAFVTALKKLAEGKIADPGRLSGYVFGVASNLLRNHRRSLVARLETSSPEASLDALVTIAAAPDQVEQDDIAEAVRTCADQLPTERERRLVRRFYFDGESKNRLCEELGWSAPYFDHVAFNARRRMRALLEQQSVG